MSGDLSIVKLHLIIIYIILINIAMATGSVFRLLINDGREDRFLSSTVALLNRIKTKNYANAASAYKDMMITHNFYIYSTYKPFVPITSQYFKLNEKQGQQIFGSETMIVVEQNGDWATDGVIHIRLSGLRAVNSPDKVKYASFLGHRIIESVRFMASETSQLDSHTTEDYNAYFNFELPPNKRTGWLRNMGQEIPYLGFLTPDPLTNNFREYRYFADGPQTLKSSHDDVDLWIPTMLWYNKSIKDAFPIYKTPKGTIKIGIKLAPLTSLVASVNNGGGGAYVAPTIAMMEYYQNYLVTLPEVRDAMLSKFSWNMIRTRRRHEQTVSAPFDSINLNNLKYAIERLEVAFRPIENYANVDNWYKNQKLTARDVKQAVVVDDPVPNTIAVNIARYYSEARVINNLDLKIADFPIYDKINSQFFNSYLTFKGGILNTPEDAGWFGLNLCLAAGERDPNGYLNNTKNRELYLGYDSSVISSTDTARLIVNAVILTFLVIDNNVTIRQFI
jgi:hypothetical protein